VRRQLFDAKILLEMAIDILLDTPQHAGWESATWLLLGGDDASVERI
jgi:hypothetical protein